MTDEDQAGTEHARSVVVKALEGSPYVYTHTTFGRGQTDYVDVYAVDPDTLRIERLTYYVSRASGHRMTDKGLPFGGGGYSKGLEAFTLTCRVAGVTAEQDRWEKLN